MINSMKNNSKGFSINPGECTEFQLHKSQQTIFHGIMNKILDYSEKRLIRCLNKASDTQQKMILVALLKDYLDGHVALAWNRGNPVWIKVTKA